MDGKRWGLLHIYHYIIFLSFCYLRNFIRCPLYTQSGFFQCKYTSFPFKIMPCFNHLRSEKHSRSFCCVFWHWTEELKLKSIFCFLYKHMSQTVMSQGHQFLNWQYRNPLERVCAICIRTEHQVFEKQCYTYNCSILH